jgi:hypothetical protein
MPRISALASKYIFVARAAYAAGYLSLASLVKRYDATLIFDTWPTSFHASYYTALGQPILYHLIESDRDFSRDMFADEVKDLSAIGSVLSDITPPWTRNVSYARLLRSWGPGTYTKSDELSEFPTLDADAVFGIFILAAAAAEVLSRNENPEAALNIFKRLELEQKIPVLSAIEAWFKNEIVDLSELAKQSGLHAHQLDIISLWLKHEINFVDANLPSREPSAVGMLPEPKT